MDKLRLRFKKTGRAIYISHLDLMKTMQRAFSRAEYELKYSEGFNPRPQISIALPLSVGMGSVCEVMDFRLRHDADLAELPSRLTAALPEGSTSTRHCTAADVETRRTRSGCLVRLTIGGQEFVTLSGTVQLEQPLQTQWLMASTANPASIRWEHLLSKSSRYHWMQGGEERVSSLEIRPDGTWRAA